MQKCETVEPTAKQLNVHMHAVLALVCIVCVVCLGSEIEVIEQLDNVTRYMTYGEIVLDLGAMLLFLLSSCMVWWACVFLFAKLAGVIPSTKRYQEKLFWLVGLSIPLSYAIFNCCDAFKLRFLPNLHVPRFGWILLSIIVLGTFAFALSRIQLSALQTFAKMRLAPIGWVHILLGAVALFALSTHHVYLFRDYVHPRPGGKRSDLPDIYLITFDALAAGECSLYGYYRPTTPGLERFAQHSFTFDYFLANSNLTTPTTTSIETGELPWSHRVYQLGGFLRNSKGGDNLAGSLHKLGYYTAMISANYLASPMQRRTLDNYDAAETAVSADSTGIWSHYTSWVGLNTRDTSTVSLRRFAILRVWLDALLWGERYPYPPEEIFRRAKELIEQPDISQPRFIWTHIYPPHDPYLPPDEFRNRFIFTNKLVRQFDFLGFVNTALPPGISEAELRGRYDETILYADHAVTGFLDWLDKTGRLDRSVVIVSSDHGESFGHGWLGHRGPYLYNDLVHVPLIIHLPGQQTAVHISQLAQQVDLLPTIVDIIGGQVPSGSDGRSLKPLLNGHVLPPAPSFSMNLEPDRIFGPVSKGTVAIVDNEFKYIYNLTSNHEELYRYRADPDEQHDLIGLEADVAAQMRTILLENIKKANRKTTFHQ